MRRMFLAAAACLLACGTAASGRVAAPPSVPQRVAQADCVVVGKVEAIEEKGVLALPYPGAKDKVEYQVAVIKIEDSLLGAKGLTHVKVGFLPAGGGGRFPQLNLTAGQEACFYLTKHFDQAFYVTPVYWDVISKTDGPDFAKETALAKRCGKLLDDPGAGLKAKEAGDRLLTAALLVLRYRTPKQGEAKTEPIDADESKRILLALAEADWAKNDPELGPRLSPRVLFAQLGATEKDGWTPPKDFNQFEPEAKKWLQDNAEKFRLQRYVAGK